MASVHWLYENLSWFQIDHPALNMKKLLFSLTLFFFLGGLFAKETKYPTYNGKMEWFDEEKNKAQLSQFYPLLSDLHLFDSQPTDVFEAELSRAASMINVKEEWPIVTPPLRMPLPAIVFSGGGLNTGPDYMVSMLSDDPMEQTHLYAYSMFWGGILGKDSKKGFSMMANLSKKDTLSTLDLLHFSVAISDRPGITILGVTPSKADWELLHKSPNPCYRFIALEYFDRVEQSPDEMLALYRECLFGSCSWLEIRALGAIHDAKDNRKAVVELLDEFVASEPHKDNTYPGYIMHPFTGCDSSEKAARYLSKQIKDHIEKHGENMPKTIQVPGEGLHTKEAPAEKAASENPRQNITSKIPDPDPKSESGHNPSHDYFWWICIPLVLAAVFYVFTRK